MQEYVLLVHRIRGQCLTLRRLEEWANLVVTRNPFLLIWTSCVRV